ncbi:uncharacterized protein C4orf45-like [Hydractinia symbiolongicarpus]|uniref:uncharacterized protein C4orf45-like n=1 Tax=Hydractinia symbiolongicarpus TaxID=13093 RepID=UPI00254DA9DA|nr:uncharacterized protein C4orf45-like [Hydractinia symbiolongicarpus]
MATREMSTTTKKAGKQEMLNSYVRNLSDTGSDRFYTKPCGKGRVLFTGPDGLCDHRVKVLEPARYVGIGIMSPEGTSELSYLWRAAATTSHPLPRSKRVGEIGWKVQSCDDVELPENCHQIMRGEFRQFGEDRHTHLYQNPWLPKPQSSKDAKVVEHVNNPLQASFTNRPNSRPVSTIKPLPQFKESRRHSISSSSTETTEFVKWNK